MSKIGSRLVSRASLIAVAAVALLAVMVGLPVYMSAATPLHADPQRVPSVASAAPAPRFSDVVERARQLVRTRLAEQNLPGVSVAVGVGRDIVWAEGFGWADVKAGAPLGPETRLRLGTASTLLTSAAVGVLLEQGRLNLDEEIQSHVPQFAKTSWPVTLQQVMAHTAGVGTDSGNDGPLFRRRCERPVEALTHVADTPLLFEPGTQYRHSKYGWILVSAAVEAAADQPFLTFMREQVFQPLGMSHTYAESTKEENPEHVGEPSEDAPPIVLVQDLILRPLGITPPRPGPAPGEVPSQATFYSPRSGGDPRQGVRGMHPHNLSCYAGSMAFLSTPSDLVQFGLAMNTGTLLQPATVQRLQASQSLTSGQQTGHGLDWDLQTVTLAGAPAQAVGHDGELRGGKVASVMLFRDRGIVVVVMSNVSSADTSSLALTIADLFAQRVAGRP